MNLLGTKLGPKQRHCLVAFVGCVILIALFYVEENWRGQRAWENCKRVLKAQGLALNWTNYIPAPVSDYENVFGVPEMQRWFKGGGVSSWSDLTRNLPSSSCPGASVDRNGARMLVAEVTIGRSGMPGPDGFSVLWWNDPTSRTKAAKLLADVVGPTAKTPQSAIGIGLMLRRPGEVEAAKIFLQGQTAPTMKEVQEFLPDSILHANAGSPTERVLRFEEGGSGSYRVTMPVLVRVADYMAWSDGLEPQFALIRAALSRPWSQMPGFYGSPNTVPRPNFYSVRNFVQTLGARAQCHLLLGEPDEALSDLALIHDFCRRVLEEDRPMTLVAAMVNVAVRGLYAEQIAEGLRLKAWREPQLVVLEEELKTIDLVSPVKQAFALEAIAAFHTLEKVPSAGFVKRPVLGGLCPLGWGYQRDVARVQLDFERVASLDTANRRIFSDKVMVASTKARALDHWSPYTFVASLAQVDFAGACQRTARNQTEVDQALIACALERFHFARGEYPETLDALIPQYLDAIPQDVIGGGAPHYRRAPDGTFVLYSIGWDGRDKGGVRGSLPGTDGDWIWPE